LNEILANFRSRSNIFIGTLHVQANIAWHVLSVTVIPTEGRAEINDKAGLKVLQMETQ